MKTLVTLLLSACTFAALAQNKTRQSLHQDIDDDGKTLTININGTANEKSIQYYRQFNVTGLSKPAREAIVNRITDSLGIKNGIHPPAPPSAPVPLKPRSVTSTVHTSVHEHGDSMVVEINGVRNSSPFKYNQTFKVKGLSKQQKNAMLRHITDSLGIGPVSSN